MTTLKKATLQDIATIKGIYDEYRFAFHLEKNNEIQDYLQSIIQSENSAIFFIENEGKAIGFAQVNITFSSFHLGKKAIVSDLYVNPISRKQGFAKQLLSAAFDFSVKNGCKNVTASSPISNAFSQELLKKIGMKKDNNYFYYNFEL